MAEVAALVAAAGGMARKQQLVRRGVRDRDLTRAVRNGDVVRVRNGWYSTLEETDPRLRAVRVGGRLTGLSLIAALGGWVVRSRDLHVAVPPNAARLRTPHDRRKRINVTAPRGVVLHWDAAADQNRGSATSVALVDALVRVILDEDLEDAVAALDWALHTGALDDIDLAQVTARLPTDLQGIARWTDTACESLPESLARTRLRLAGHTVVTQIPLDSERIDLVVDHTVGLEVDGEEFHRNTFEQDRAKDARITIAGFHALRPSARMVFRDWPVVLRAIEAALAARGRRPAPAVGNSGARPPAVRHRPGRPRTGRSGRARAPEFPTSGAGSAPRGGGRRGRR
jgi:very-short-patch-repair endonuclease